jgi:L-methionine (R)-S-oxide reductase
MAEEIITIEGEKSLQYESILAQIAAFLQYEADLVANMGNIAAALKQQFNWLWVGFYLVKSDQLVLGPFQGPVACTRIAKGQGVCGHCWESGATVIVPDVTLFPGHIACSSLSNSEIVVPLIKEGIVWGVLDIDSITKNTFDETDRFYLEKLSALIH